MSILANPAGHRAPGTSGHAEHDNLVGARLPDRTAHTGGRGPLGRGLLSLSRPGQWHKNALVVTAPAAAGILDHAGVLANTALLLVAFIAASSAVYAVNDVRDAALDRGHPRKRYRPVAAGLVSPTVALGWAALSSMLAIGLAAYLGASTLGVVASYLALSVAYTLWLKHVAVLDVVAVATGFLLRALAGAAANQLPVSNWFLLVALFGSLYLVAGKRVAETQRMGSDHVTRPVLNAYPAAWLQQVLTLALAGTVISYAMWAFQYLGTDVFRPLLAASVLPFLVALLRYGLLLSQGGGERPESLLLRDLTLVVAGGTWAAIVGASLYLA